jgi:ATP-binding cassette subfamily B protein
VVKNGAVDFQNVGFHYNHDTKIFHGFNLKVRPGEKLALVGPSGGGKSTVIKLLFRFKDIQEGRILIDGQDICQVTQDSLRQAVALVPQDPILFHRSLMDNIRYGRPEATDEEVYAAAKAAHAHEFISKLPEGYKTFVGERGVKLSGGERQRVAIARAILKNAQILVLDEATSSLDSESEYYIQDALNNLMKNKTTIVIAHRLSTIREMDRIIVMEDGQVKEEGTHDELLSIDEGLYQRLWNRQVHGFASV